MSALVVIQPHFLPFAGYFDLMRRADWFVYYDTVQFRRRSWHCRTWLRDGTVARWLSAPVRTRSGSRVPIADVVWADEQPWRGRVLRRLESVYGGRLPAWLVELIGEGPGGLADWNVLANDTLAQVLGIGTRTVRASALAPVQGDKQARLVALCRHFGATTYVCGPGSRGYVDDALFESAGIHVEWVTYEYNHRLRAPSGEWVFPSLLDVLLTEGVDRARQEVGLTGPDYRLSAHPERLGWMSSDGGKR